MMWERSRRLADGGGHMELNETDVEGNLKIEDEHDSYGLNLTVLEKQTTAL
jgi:hypothetical protein